MQRLLFGLVLRRIADLGVAAAVSLLLAAGCGAPTVTFSGKSWPQTVSVAAETRETEEELWARGYATIGSVEATLDGPLSTAGAVVQTCQRRAAEEGGELVSATKPELGTSSVRV